MELSYSTHLSPGGELGIREEKIIQTVSRTIGYGTTRKVRALMVHGLSGFRAPGTKKPL